MNTKLPIPSEAAQGLSDKLLEQIKSEIAEKGQIPFERYMSLALYAPNFGYYRNGLCKFGESGDFVTAPEISSLFSECIARQCAQVLCDLGGGDILEFGAGRGVMAADILRYLQKTNQLPTHSYILEVSANLQRVQYETIEKNAPDLLSRVIWLQSLPEKPMNGVILANEVLDAMPVTLFRQEEGGVKECGVTVSAGTLEYCALPNDNLRLKSYLSAANLNFAPGYTSEVNLHLEGWVAGLSKSLNQGLVLLIDYGFPRHEYYHPERDQGTLMCHYQHLAHTDPFFHPGLQDVTAHVDFTAVAEAADSNGFNVKGYVHQAGFLLSCGLLSLLEEKNEESRRFSQNQAVLRLTMPSEMGELFKVMGLTKAYDVSLMGFEKMNQLERLG